MPKAIDRLQHRQVKHLPPGRHPDGKGLYLDVKEPKAEGVTPPRSWSLVFMLKGERREMGLGSAYTVTLAEARDLRDAAKRLAKAGVDPIAERRAARLTQDLTVVVPMEPKGRTFGQFADERFEKLCKRWESPRTRQSWVNTLENWCTPIRSLPLSEIRQKHILMVVEPKWETTVDMAAQTQERLKSLFDTAIALGEHPGPNPARWEEALEHILAPKKRLARGKHAAMDFEEAPAFYQYLTGRRGVGARALQFTMLTGVRTDQTLGARWCEFDLREKVWRIPLKRCLKIRNFLRENNYDHFPVPISPTVLAILKGQIALNFGSEQVKDHAFVFPGTKSGCSISNGTMERCIDEYGGPHATVHGMRTTFRDWAGERMILIDGRPRRAYSDEGCEIFIGHIVGDAARQAYRRRQAMPERRVIAQEWGEYLVSGPVAAGLTPAAAA